MANIERIWRDQGKAHTWTTLHKLWLTNSEHNPEWQRWWAYLGVIPQTVVDEVKASLTEDDQQGIQGLLEDAAIRMLACAEAQWKKRNETTTQ